MNIRSTGSSLVEVLIATMILGVSALAIVGGLFISRTSTDRLSEKSAALSDLALLSQQVAMMPFISCSATSNTSPYSAPSAPAGSKLTAIAVSVEVAGATLGAMQPCGTPSAQQQPLQLVTVSASFRGETLSRSVLKVRP